MGQVCPSRDELSAFSTGSLPDEAFEAVASHVEGCAACLSILDSLPAADSLLEAARGSVATDPYWQEPECQTPAALLAEILSRVSDSTVDRLGDDSSVAAGNRRSADVGALKHFPSGDGQARYDNLGVINEGGMGVIYRAYDRILGCTVALKMIRSAGASAVQRFLLEARSVAQLRHDSVVKIRDFGQIGGQPYFAMELAERGSLADHLAEFQQDPKRSVRLLGRVARAVHHVHEYKIVHRDLKPSNILLEADDKPVVSDFGLARWLEGASELTHPGEAPGTAPYMAPELFARPNDTPRPTIDVWALGVILYEMVTGRRPFDGRRREDYARAILYTEPRRPRARQPRLDCDLETIILKCLDKNPARRYASAQLLAEDLERYLRDEPIQGRRLPRVVRAARWCRTRPGAIAAGVLLPLVPLLAILMHSPATVESPPPRDEKEVLLERLRAGEKVVLIRDSGLPRWYEIRKGPAGLSLPGNDENNPPGLFTWDFSFVELIPDPCSDSYLYRASVKQGGSHQGEMGVYLLGAESQGKDGNRERYTFTVNFSDRGGLPAKVYFYAWRFGPKGPRSSRIAEAPLPKTADGWRDIDVRVTPEQIEVLLQGNPLWKLQTDKIAARLAFASSQKPGTPPAKLIWRSPAGLFAYRTEALFRNVSFQPF